MVQVLKQCGADLARENIMKQAATLKDFSSDVMLPGIKINTSPDDFFPIEQMQLMKFDGTAWHLFGDVITGAVGHERSHCPPATDWTRPVAHVPCAARPAIAGFAMSAV